jgi:hypothetical protein
MRSDDRQPSATSSRSRSTRGRASSPKIAGLFTARGYNIDSLTVADISEEPRAEPDHHRHQWPACR